MQGHQTFLDRCNEFNTWLRAVRERLASCSDTYGDKAAIEAKMDKLKVSCLCNLQESLITLKSGTCALDPCVSVILV